MLGERCQLLFVCCQFLRHVQPVFCVCVHPVHLRCASVLQQGLESVNYGSSVMSKGSHLDGHPPIAAAG